MIPRLLLGRRRAGGVAERREAFDRATEGADEEPSRHSLECFERQYRRSAVAQDQREAPFRGLLFIPLQEGITLSGRA